MNPATRIKVVGVGGSGGNAVSRMAKYQIKGVELVAINTDVQDLKKARASFKVRIGKKLTQGLGAGMNPEIGKLAAQEQRDEILEVLKETDLIFLTYGAGGGTGSGAGPIIAEIAKNSGVLTVAVVTTPFSFEGQTRQKIAQEGIAKLKEKVDTLLTIKNDRLLEILDPKTTVSNAFWICDDILRQAVQGISDLITMPGIINVDFSGLKTVMKNAGSAIFGVGVASGEGRAERAAKAALSSPLIDFSPKGAKGILFNVVGGEDLSLAEVDQVAKIITQEVNSSAKIIFGAVYSKTLKKGEIKVIVIATGF